MIMLEMYTVPITKGNTIAKSLETLNSNAANYTYPLKFFVLNELEC